MIKFRKLYKKKKKQNKVMERRKRIIKIRVKYNDI